MHTKIFSATTIGVHAHQVDVEVDLAFGLIDFLIVGLPDTAIKESKQRVVTALKNSGFKSPEKKNYGKSCAGTFKKRRYIV